MSWERAARVALLNTSGRGIFERGLRLGEVCVPIAQGVPLALLFHPGMTGRSSFVDFESCATMNSCIGLADHLDGVHLGELAPLTTLLVRTRNSLYRIVVIKGSDVYVQGGTHFPDPTSAHLDGARLARGCVKVGWIGVGFPIEIRAGDSQIVTSSVHAIFTERSGRSAVVRLVRKVFCLLGLAVPRPAQNLPLSPDSCARGVEDS